MIAGRAAQVKDALQTQLWPLPALAVVVAVVLGIALPALDAAVDGRLPQGFAALLFGGGPEPARAVLQAIAGSLITVTSLTFSLTVVTLQLASASFRRGCCAHFPATGLSTRPWRCSWPPSPSP